MNDLPLKCPKCGDDMIQGFVVDAKAHWNGFLEWWQEGAPEKSIWTGTKLDRSRQLPVATFRCSQCGFLESYASKLFDAK